MQVIGKVTEIHVPGTTWPCRSVRTMPALRPCNWDEHYPWHQSVTTSRATCSGQVVVHAFSLQRMFFILFSHGQLFASTPNSPHPSAKSCVYFFAFRQSAYHVLPGVVLVIPANMLMILETSKFPLAVRVSGNFWRAKVRNGIYRWKSPRGYVNPICLKFKSMCLN